MRSEQFDSELEVELSELRTRRERGRVREEDASDRKSSRGELREDAASRGVLINAVPWEDEGEDKG